MTLLIALAGGLGAATRLVLHGLIRTHTAARFPWGTVLINSSGAFALGLVMAAATSDHWQAIAGVGFLGGYTTFSTASVETARLAHDGRYRAALANTLGALTVAVAAASLGYWLATR